MENEKLTASIVQEYQGRFSRNMSIRDYKLMGRELRDRFNLTDREALDLINNRNVIEILSKHEEANNE